MEWITSKSHPKELFGFRVAEVSDGTTSSYARIGRIQLIDRILDSYMNGYSLDGNEYDDVRSSLCLIIHSRFSADSEGVAVL